MHPEASTRAAHRWASGARSDRSRRSTVLSHSQQARAAAEVFKCLFQARPRACCSCMPRCVSGCPTP